MELYPGRIVIRYLVEPQKRLATNVPPKVKRYVQEHLDQGMDEGKAWAIAWSRYCKYTNPDSPSCSKDDYFSGRSAINVEYFHEQKTRPWLFWEKDPYQWAMGDLNETLLRWIEMPQEGKSPLLEAYQNLHPELKEALDKEVRRVVGSKTLGWRYNRQGKFPSNLGGYSLHCQVEPSRLRGEDPSRFQVYEVASKDIMLHPDMKNSPLNEGRWSFEREMVLKPNARPKALSDRAKLDLIQSLL